MDWRYFYVAKQISTHILEANLSQHIYIRPCFQDVHCIKKAMTNFAIPFKLQVAKKVLQ